MRRHRVSDEPKKTAVGSRMPRLRPMRGGASIKEQLRGDTTFMTLPYGFREYVFNHADTKLQYLLEKYRNVDEAPTSNADRLQPLIQQLRKRYNKEDARKLEWSAFKLARELGDMEKDASILNESEHAGESSTARVAAERWNTNRMTCELCFDQRKPRSASFKSLNQYRSHLLQHHETSALALFVCADCGCAFQKREAPHSCPSWQVGEDFSTARLALCCGDCGLLLRVPHSEPRVPDEQPSEAERMIWRDFRSTMDTHSSRSMFPLVVYERRRSDNNPTVTVPFASRGSIDPGSGGTCAYCDLLCPSELDLKKHLIGRACPNSPIRGTELADIFADLMQQRKISSDKEIWRREDDDARSLRQFIQWDPYRNVGAIEPTAREKLLRVREREEKLMRVPEFEDDEALVDEAAAEEEHDSHGCQRSLNYEEVAASYRGVEGNEDWFDGWTPLHITRDLDNELVNAFAHINPTTSEFDSTPFEMLKVPITVARDEVEAAGDANQLPRIPIGVRTSHYVCGGCRSVIAGSSAYSKHKEACAKGDEEKIQLLIHRTARAPPNLLVDCPRCLSVVCSLRGLLRHLAMDHGVFDLRIDPSVNEVVAESTSKTDLINEFLLLEDSKRPPRLSPLPQAVEEEGEEEEEEPEGSVVKEELSQRVLVDANEEREEESPPSSPSSATRSAEIDEEVEEGPGDPMPSENPIVTFAVSEFLSNLDASLMPPLVPEPESKAAAFFIGQYYKWGRDDPATFELFRQQAIAINAVHRNAHPKQTDFIHYTIEMLEDSVYQAFDRAKKEGRKLLEDAPRPRASVQAPAPMANAVVNAPPRPTSSRAEPVPKKRKVDEILALAAPAPEISLRAPPPYPGQAQPPQPRAQPLPPQPDVQAPVQSGQELPRPPVHKPRATPEERRNEAQQKQQQALQSTRNVISFAAASAALSTQPPSVPLAQPAQPVGQTPVQPGQEPTRPSILPPRSQPQPTSSGSANPTSTQFQQQPVTKKMWPKAPCSSPTAPAHPGQPLALPSAAQPAVQNAVQPEPGPSTNAVHGQKPSTLNKTQQSSHAAPPQVVSPTAPAQPGQPQTLQPAVQPAVKIPANPATGQPRPSILLPRAQPHVSGAAQTANAPLQQQMNVAHPSTTTASSPVVSSSAQSGPLHQQLQTKPAQPAAPNTVQPGQPPAAQPAVQRPVVPRVAQQLTQQPAASNTVPAVQGAPQSSMPQPRAQPQPAAQQGTVQPGQGQQPVAQNQVQAGHRMQQFAVFPPNMVVLPNGQAVVMEQQTAAFYAQMAAQQAHQAQLAQQPQQAQPVAQRAQQAQPVARRAQPAQNAQTATQQAQIHQRDQQILLQQQRQHKQMMQQQQQAQPQQVQQQQFDAQLFQQIQQNPAAYQAQRDRENQQMQLQNRQQLAQAQQLQQRQAANGARPAHPTNARLQQNVHNVQQQQANAARPQNVNTTIAQQQHQHGMQMRISPNAVYPQNVSLTQLLGQPANPMLQQQMLMANPQMRQQFQQQSPNTVLPQPVVSQHQQVHPLVSQQSPNTAPPQNFMFMPQQGAQLSPQQQLQLQQQHQFMMMMQQQMQQGVQQQSPNAAPHQSTMAPQQQQQIQQRVQQQFQNAVPPQPLTLQEKQFLQACMDGRQQSPNAVPPTGQAVPTLAQVLHMELQQQSPTVAPSNVSSTASTPFQRMQPLVPQQVSTAGPSRPAAPLQQAQQQPSPSASALQRPTNLLHVQQQPSPQIRHGQRPHIQQRQVPQPVQNQQTGPTIPSPAIAQPHCQPGPSTATSVTPSSSTDKRACAFCEEPRSLSELREIQRDELLRFYGKDDPPTSILQMRTAIAHSGGRPFICKEHVPGQGIISTKNLARCPSKVCGLPMPQYEKAVHNLHLIKDPAQMVTHVCIPCGAQFKDERQAFQHYYTVHQIAIPAEGIRHDLVCPIRGCGRAFIDQDKASDDLLEHLSTEHMDKLPFECAEGHPSIRFGSKAARALHAQRHHHDDVEFCIICGLPEWRMKMRRTIKDANGEREEEFEACHAFMHALPTSFNCRCCFDSIGAETDALDHFTKRHLENGQCLMCEVHVPTSGHMAHALSHLVRCLNLPIIPYGIKSDELRFFLGFRQ